MDRPIFFKGQIPRAYDLLKAIRDTDKAIGDASLGLLGGAMSGASGVPGAQGTPEIGIPTPYYNNLAVGIDAGGYTTGLQVGYLGHVTGANGVVAGFSLNWSNLLLQIDRGTVYALGLTDAISTLPSGASPPTAGYGSLATDAEPILHECRIPPSQFSLAAPALGGVSNWYIVYALGQQLDATDPDDPSLGVGAANALLLYYNSANPNTPLNGPAGAGTLQATARKAAGPNQTTAGMQPTAAAGIFLHSMPASSGSGSVGVYGGSQVSTASLDPSGCAIPLYIIQVISGDTTIKAGQVWHVGRGGAPTGTNSPLSDSPNPPAPFLSGLLGQHHLGIAGSAPKIDGGVEWKPLSAVNNNGQQIVDVGATPAPSPALTAGSRSQASPVVAMASLFPASTPQAWTNFPAIGSGSPTLGTSLPAGTSLTVAAAKMAIYQVASGTPLWQRMFLALEISGAAGTISAGSTFLWTGAHQIPFPTFFPNSLTDLFATPIVGYLTGVAQATRIRAQASLAGAGGMAIAGESAFDLLISIDDAVTLGSSDNFQFGCWIQAAGY